MMLFYLKHLEWLPTALRTESRVLSMAPKALHNMAPAHLSDFTSHASTSHEAPFYVLNILIPANEPSHLLLLLPENTVPQIITQLVPSH